MIGVLLVFDVEAVAKLASAFQLLLFGLICVAVIVMRESQIPTYKPGFRAPLYPWLQVAGILIAFWLIIEMGILAIAFTGMVLIGCVLWYQFYAAGRLERRGAIFHVHQRLGQQKYEGLEMELMSIIHDRTRDENLSYETLIARSAMLDLRYGRYDFEHLGDVLFKTAEQRFTFPETIDVDEFLKSEWRFRPLDDSVFLAFKTHSELTQPELFVCRFGPQTKLELEGIESAHTLLFLIVPNKPAGLDLRLAGHLAEVIQSDNFEERWLAAREEKELNAILMRDDHFYHGPVDNIPTLRDQLGKKVSEIELPASCLLALIERDNDIRIATADEVLQPGDYVAIIGEPEDVSNLLSRKLAALGE